MKPVDYIYNGFVDAMLWASTYETADEMPEDFYGESYEDSFESKGFVRSDLTPEAQKTVRRMCQQFYDYMIAEDMDDNFDWYQVGCDFYFTSYGHGVGFWDRKEFYGDYADALTALADKFNEVYPYDTDGRIGLDGGGLRMTAHMLKSKETDSVMSEYDWRGILGDEFNLDDFVEV